MTASIAFAGWGQEMVGRYLALTLFRRIHFELRFFMTRNDFSGYIGV